MRRVGVMCRFFVYTVFFVAVHAKELGEKIALPKSWFINKLIFFQLGIYGLSVAAHPSLNLHGKDTPVYKTNLIFPDSAETTSLTFYPETSPKCRNQTFCEHIKNYPSDLFHDILESANYGERYSQYFRKIEDEVVAGRMDQKDKYFLCPSTKMVVYPKAAYNVKHQLKFIYNLDSYRQGVIIEVCVRKSRCRLYDNIRNFKTRCTQKYVKKLLLTADDSGKPYVDRYVFPTACVCSYKTVTSYSRFSNLYRRK